jgi:hypothetical protein
MSLRLLILAAPLLALAACGRTNPAALSAPADPSCEVAGRLELAAGETRELTAAEARCFLLSSGEYVLAGFDARQVAAAREGRAADGAAPAYRIADATTGGARSASPAPWAAAPPAPPAHVAMGAAAAPHSPYSRATPWREGERFDVAPLEGAGPVRARVVKVAGPFVLAVVERDEAPAGRVLQQAGEALEFLAREGVPVLRSVFADEVPATSGGSGQLLVLATAWDPDLGAGATWTDPSAGAARSFVWLNLNLRPGVRPGYEMYDHASYRVKVLAHELTHAWQADWARRGGRGDGAGWGAEGGADLVAMELVRSYLRLGANANWRWQEHLQPSRSSVVYALEPAGTHGRVPHGYYDASSLLRDFQWRLQRAGVPPAAAMAEVSRGSLEGWYGEGCAGGCPGLAERMRARLGAGWTPEAGVLLWTLSQAADDRTANPELANPAYHRAASADAPYGWKPAARLRSRTGASTDLAAVAGGSFYAELGVPGAEGVFTATGPEETRWMVARLR